MTGVIATAHQKTPLISFFLVRYMLPQEWTCWVLFLIYLYWTNCITSWTMSTYISMEIHLFLLLTIKSSFYLQSNSLKTQKDLLANLNCSCTCTLPLPSLRFSDNSSYFYLSDFCFLLFICYMLYICCPLCMSWKYCHHSGFCNFLWLVVNNFAWRKEKKDP